MQCRNYFICALLYLLQYFKECANLRSLVLRMNRYITPFFFSVQILLLLYRKISNDDMIDFCSAENGCTQLVSLDVDRILGFTAMRISYENKESLQVLDSIQINLPNLQDLFIDNAFAEMTTFELRSTDLRKLGMKVNVTTAAAV